MRTCAVDDKLTGGLCHPINALTGQMSRQNKKEIEHNKAQEKGNGKVEPLALPLRHCFSDNKNREINSSHPYTKWLEDTCFTVLENYTQKKKEKLRSPEIIFKEKVNCNQFNTQ